MWSCGVLNFSQCRKCRYGRVHPGKESEDGEWMVRPSVFCRLAGMPMLFDSEPPDDCPYAMEHAMAMQSVDSDFLDWMSGRST